MSVVYQIVGKEKEQMAEMQKSITAMQESFLAIAGFIARREGVSLDKVEFNPATLSFVTVEKVKKE